MDNILCFITGPERNGTTYFSHLIYSLPEVYSGFETGIMISKNFYHNTPFSEWIYHRGQHWGVSSNILFKDSMSYEEKYNILYNNKGSYHKNCIYQKLIYESKWIVDKTPRYIYNIKNLIFNIPLNIPIFIVLKKLKDFYISVCVKRESSNKKFIENIKLIIENLNFLKNNMNKNIHVFLYDDILKDIFVKKINTIVKERYKKDINICYEDFLKKTKGNRFVYSDWKKTSITVELPQDIKFFEKEYDSLIDQLKTN